MNSEENTPNYYMNEALKEAQIAYSKDEVPVGAVIVCEGKIISRAHNLKESLKTATKHAELLAIEKASEKLGRWRLTDCDLYVTLEPCPMCAGAILNARLKSISFGTEDPKSGYITSLHQLFENTVLNHKPLVFPDILKNECSTLLKDFFKLKRTRSKTKL